MDDTELQELRSTISDLRAEIAVLRESVGRVTDQVQTAPHPSSSLVGSRISVEASQDPQTDHAADVGGRTSRRNLLRLIGASATGVVAGTLAAPLGAAAAEGDPVLIGRTTTNSAAANMTRLNNSTLVANGPDASEGVQGSSNGSTGYGVWGRSNTGYGVVGESTTGIDIATRGTGRLHLREHTFGGTYLTGEIARDVNGSFWACVSGGSPGVWRKIASADSAGSTHFLANPIRLIVRIFGGRTDVQVGGTSASGLTIPAGATGIFGAVFGQCLSSASGFVTLFPSDGASDAGTLTATAQLTSAGFGGSSFTAKLSATGSLGMYTSGLSHIVVDVGGYYL